MPTTRADLESLVQSYAHRFDMASKMGAFISMATKRIGRDLRSPENEQQITFTMATNPEPLPADFRGIREIFYAGAGGNIWLNSAPLRQMANTSGVTPGQARYYAIEGKGLKTSPTRLGDYTLLYWFEPADLVLPTDTNDVLQVYTDLYLYATLMEVYFYIQDGELASASRTVYMDLLRRINIMAEGARVGSVPQMKG